MKVPPGTIYNIIWQRKGQSSWGLSSYLTYKAWREKNEFAKGVFTYSDRMDPEQGGMEDAFPVNDDFFIDRECRLWM